MKRGISLVISGFLVCSSVCLSNATAITQDNSLWEKCLRYDLCITNYNSLTDEEKELCHFIFDTEQAAGDNIVCERARRTLAGDDVGERITIGQLKDAYGVWDYGSFYQTYYGWHSFIDCVPDVICLDLDRYASSYVWYNKMEYWLDDERSSYMLYVEKANPDTQSRFEIYDGNDNLIETIPVKFDSPMIDFRGEKEYMEDFGMIEKNGGWYYTKPDGTAVFAWSNYSGGQSSEKITEPFVIESEINGFPVTAIEQGALAQSPFTEIVLPDLLKIIDGNAFMNCQYLEKINFPEGLEYIGERAFWNCNSITDLTLDCPNLVIAGGAFSELRGLKTANINARDICESAVSNCKCLESITLGDSVENIKYGAFGGNIRLTDINIPNNVKTIGQEALVNFTSVTIPPTVEIIGTYPHKTAEVMTSGIEPPPPVRPLTDKPKCAFNDNCIIYGYTGTEAERYAEEWRLEFVPLDYTEGDANFDGEFTIADAVSLQNYLLGRHETGLIYWKAADFCEDDQLNVLDLTLMKSALIQTLNG